MKTVSIQGRSITDWASFHAEFMRALAFPAFYGRNMNAWIDCMSSLDEGMSETLDLAPGETVCIAIEDAADFKLRCPEQFQALLEASAFVNWRRIENGEPAVLLLSCDAG